MRKKIKKIKPKEKKQQTSLKPANSIFKWFASIFLLAAVLVLYPDQTTRLLRLCVYGDGSQRLKCGYSIDDVPATWGYACWLGPFSRPTQKFGFSLYEQGNERFRIPVLNHNIEGAPLILNGVTFAQGIGGHAPSKIAFDLRGKYSRFTCKAGLDQAAGDNHGIVFSVIADGKTIYESPKLPKDTDPFPIDCSVAGVKELVLFADSPQFDDVLSDVDWVDLKFEPVSAPRP